MKETYGQKKTSQMPKMALSGEVTLPVFSSPDYSFNVVLLSITKLALAQKLDQKLLLFLIKLQSHLLNLDL